jgi:hypothetical protein
MLVYSTGMNAGVVTVMASMDLYLRPHAALFVLVTLQIHVVVTMLREFSVQVYQVKIILAYK